MRSENSFRACMPFIDGWLSGYRVHVQRKWGSVEMLKLRTNRDATESAAMHACNVLKPNKSVRLLVFFGCVCVCALSPTSCIENDGRKVIWGRMLVKKFGIFRLCLKMGERLGGATGFAPKWKTIVDTARRMSSRWSAEHIWLMQWGHYSHAQAINCAITCLLGVSFNIRQSVVCVCCVLYVRIEFRSP